MGQENLDRKQVSVIVFEWKYATIFPRKMSNQIHEMEISMQKKEHWNIYYYWISIATTGIMIIGICHIASNFHVFDQSTNLTINSMEEAFHNKISRYDMYAVFVVNNLNSQWSMNIQIYCIVYNTESTCEMCISNEIFSINLAKVAIRCFSK